MNDAYKMMAGIVKRIDFSLFIFAIASRFIVVINSSKTIDKRGRYGERPLYSFYRDELVRR
jgi:hypothetical protein